MVWLLGALAVPPLAVAADAAAIPNASATSASKPSTQSVSSVLKYIEKHSDYVFVYAEGANRQLGKRIDISLSGNVDNILADMCAKANLDYRVLGRQVTLFPKGKMPKTWRAPLWSKER